MRSTGASAQTANKITASVATTRSDCGLFVGYNFGSVAINDLTTAFVDPIVFQFLDSQNGSMLLTSC